MLRRFVLTAAGAAILAIAVGCGAGSERHAPTALDGRALVVQPPAVGGVRSVRGSWSTLGDDGSYPLADAFQGRRVPGNIAFKATYAGLAGSAAGTTVNALAVVLPDAATARRLLRSSRRVEGFVADDAEPSLTAADPPGDADAAVAGTAAHGSVTPGPAAVVAWRKGRLYGLVATSGAGARALAIRIAATQETRFEEALAGGRLTVDALLRVPDQITGTPFPPPYGRTVQPSATVPVIDHAGVYSLQDLGVGRLVFSPAKGELGVQFPVALALPPTPRGRWLWRIRTHVIVTLASGARLGQVQVAGHISNTGAPGAQLVVARDLGSGRTVLVEELRHTLSATSLEVRMQAMMGGNPSPRQDALAGFSITWLGAGAERSLARVEVLPDSAIEVFDDPAQIGRFAISISLSVARP